MDAINIEAGTDVSRIGIYDLKGSLVKQVFTNGGNRIEASDLNSGAYIIRMWDRDGVSLSTNAVVKQ